MTVLKVKHSPAGWCLQKPGKTDWAARYHGTLSSLWTPPLWWPHPPKRGCLDPGSAQPSGLVTGSPQVPPDDTNKEDIWIAFLFVMAKSPRCTDCPSSKDCAAVFKVDWRWNACLTTERLKTLRSEYVVYRENGPKFASSHSASLSISCLQTKARKWMLAYVPFSKHYLSMIHTEQVKCQLSSHCHFSTCFFFFTISNPWASPHKQPHSAVSFVRPTRFVDDTDRFSQVAQQNVCDSLSSRQRHCMESFGQPAHSAQGEKKDYYAVPSLPFCALVQWNLACWWNATHTTW